MNELKLLPFFLDSLSRFGNPHHGIVDGTTLDDGGAGVPHPTLIPYVQSPGLWVTPALELHVPGHTFIPPVYTLPEVAPADETWLDHAVLSGCARALYQKNIFTATPSGHAYRFLVSFGVGDTWACTISSSSVAVSVGGGSAQCLVVLTPFGQFGIDPAPDPISLPTNVLSPCGQPSYGGANDFPADALILRPFDVSQNGQSVILGVVKDDPTFSGYGAPRGFLRLDITKAGATLSLLKSRADLLAGVNQTYSLVGTGGIDEADFGCTGSGAHTVPVAAFTYTETRDITASNLFAAFFNAAGAVDYLRYNITSNLTRVATADGYSINCSGCSGGVSTGCDVAPSTVVATANNGAHTGTVTIVRDSDSSTLATASFSDSASYSGTASYIGSDTWHSVGDAPVGMVYSGTALGGTAYSQPFVASTILDLTTSAIEVPMLGFTGVFIEYEDSVVGTVSRTASTEGGSLGPFVRQVGMLGLFGHSINIAPVETFIGAARHEQYIGIAGSGTHSPVVCAHPVTGQIIYQMALNAAYPNPSYGWA